MSRPPGRPVRFRGPGATEDRSFPRVAGGLAIASVPVAAANLLTIGVAARFHLDAVSKPLELLRTGGTAGARWWHLSMILDLLGYYLMIVPLVIWLWNRLRPRHPDRADLFALCLVAYSLIGAIGAAVLATAVPPLIASYTGASASQRAILDVVGSGYADSMYRGLWNLLEEFLAGVGWVGLGMLLKPSQQRLGRVTIVLGAACLLDSLGTALNLDLISLPGLSAYLVLAPAWAAWLGIRLLRDSTGLVPPVTATNGGIASPATRACTQACSDTPVRDSETAGHQPAPG